MIVESQKDRETDWIALLSAGCDEVESTVESFPDLAERAREYVEFRCKQMFGPRNWSPETLDGEVYTVIELGFLDAPIEIREQVLVEAIEVLKSELESHRMRENRR